MALKNLRLSYFLVFLALPVLFSCSASKSKQSKFAYRTYHDITMHYNYWWNANYILEQGLKNKASTVEYNYNEVLPLYPYGTPQNTADMGPDMDKVIKKTSVGIQLHENSKWEDDAYLLMGQAHYMKGEYKEAVQVFQHITSTFNQGIRQRETTKKRSQRRVESRTAEENPYYSGFTSFLKHKPARYEAIIWLIKSYAHLGRMDEAQSIIAFAQNDELYPEQLRDDLQLAVTEFYLLQNNYQAAADALRKGLIYTKDKKYKTRYTYIIGQLAQRSDNNLAAIDHYREVLELKPDYEMEFYAKINIANLSKEEESISTNEVIALLRDMLRNEKYKRFNSEIYFALAEIYDKREEMDKALQNYQLAVNTANKNEQKAQAYLRLAEIYFDRQDYVVSKNYHDSTLAVLPPEDPAYQPVSDRGKILQNLVTQIETIAVEDSLQRLANMSDEELMKVWLDMQKREEEKRNDIPRDEFNPFEDAVFAGTGSWPFDNPGLRSQGFSEFKRIWGDRPRENNWRRMDRDAVAFDETDTPEDGMVGEIPASFEDFVGTLPRGDEDLLASNNRMIDAYWAQSAIYRDDLENDPEALRSYEEFFNRFPQNRYRNEIAYNLYLLYQPVDMQKSNYYKNVVLNEYPESVLAQVIQNPDYIAETQQKQNAINNYYATTYSMYEGQQYDEVINRVMQADSLFEENPMKPQFDMLHALAYGGKGDMVLFKEQLEKVVNDHPLHEVKTKALEILNLMEGQAYEDRQPSLDPTQKFKLEMESPHYVLVVFTEVTPQTSGLQNVLGAYNDVNHSREGLQLNNLLLNEQMQVLVIKEFPNAERALRYFNGIRYNEKIFGGMNEEIYETFAISKHNYGVFFREKDVSSYMQFFTQNYLKQ